MRFAARDASPGLARGRLRGVPVRDRDSEVGLEPRVDRHPQRLGPLDLTLRLVRPVQEPVGHGEVVVDQREPR